MNIPTRENFRPKILVVGDIMLDHYRIGAATRISPEAPVPVLLNPTDEYRLGGAGAVAAMCAALGAEVALMGAVGHDHSARKVGWLLEQAGVTFAGVAIPHRTTTTKERICGVASGRHRQQLGRIDFEDATPLPGGPARDLAALIESLKEDPPAVIIIADYAKGVCVDKIVQACRDTGRPVFVDPPKGFEAPRYYGVTCIVPNREEAAGKNPRDICRQLQTEAAVVKLDQDGCEYFTREFATRSIKSAVRAVHDVTGAGDQFISVLAWARAAYVDWPDAAQLANTAAGLQVERHGCVPVTLEELQTAVSQPGEGVVFAPWTIAS